MATIKCKRGWIFAKSKSSKKVVPYFVKVRSEDIVKTGVVDISECLTQGSLEWDITKIPTSNSDISMYRCIINHDADNDYVSENPTTHEIRLSNHNISELIYTIYKDGRYNVKGYASIDYNDTSGLNPSTSTSMKEGGLYLKYLVLPFGIENMIRTSVSFDDGTNVFSIHSNIEKTDLRTIDVDVDTTLSDVTGRTYSDNKLSILLCNATSSGVLEEFNVIQNVIHDTSDIDYRVDGLKEVKFRIDIEGFWI